MRFFPFAQNFLYFFLNLLKNYTIYGIIAPSIDRNIERTIKMIEFFTATLGQLITLFGVLLVGYFLKKKDILPDNSDRAFSRLLAWAASPALCFRTFSNNFKIENMATNLGLIITGTVVLLASFIISKILSPSFSKGDSYLNNIYLYSFTISNIGYMGYPITQAVFGDAAMFNMMIFCIPLNVFIYSFGLAMLNPVNKKITFKSLINPIFASMILGALFGVFNITLPGTVSSIVSMFADSMSFLAMIVTGFTIAKYPLKDMLSDPKIYLASFLRLVAIPALIVGVIVLLKFPKTYVISALCSLAMPLGLNTVIFPASYGGDTRPGASMALISTFAALITIPLMFAVFGGSL